MKQVLIAASISDTFIQVLLDSGYELIYVNSNEQVLSSDKNSVVGIVTSNKLQLHKEALQHFANLKWIARLGSGMEIIDTKYCDEHRILYYSSPNGIANAVAEHVTGMLLSLLHHIHSSHQQITNGQWIREANRGRELQGMSIGIIGYGHTGSAFAQKMSVFAKKIMVYDKYKTGFGSEQIKEATLDELQQQAEVISFHVPLNSETSRYYNEDFILAMRKPHIFINASRGSVASTVDVVNGLKSGKISGACLDVLDEEKHINDILKQQNNIIQELLKFNVIITPHIAGYSHNAIEKMSDELVNQLKAIL